MSELRLGLVGAGRWGQRYIKTLEQLPGAQLAAVSSSNPRTASLVPRDCVIVEDWHVLAECSPALDGVIIATPTAQHAPIANFMLGAGLPVLVEKPMASSLAQARQLGATAEACGQLLMVGHTHLYSAAYQGLKAEASLLGQLLRVTTIAGGPGPFREDTSPLWDWGAHDIALCLDLAGSAPSGLSARRLESSVTAAGYAENVELTLTFAEDCVASIRVGNMMSKKCRRFTAEFEQGSLVYDDFASAKLVRETPAGHVHPLAIDDGLPLTRQLSAFCSAIMEGRYSDPSLSLGVAVIEVLERCDELLADGQRKV